MDKKEKMETINETNGINPEAMEMIKPSDIPVKPKEPLAEVMGDIGKWQIKRIAIVFLIGIPEET